MTNKDIKKQNMNENSTEYMSKNPQNQKNRLILKLMKKYNISSQEAENILKKIEIKQKSNKEIYTDKPTNTPKKDVDEIISNIIPDYNQQISIEVNHVDLTFEVSNEKVDTIKESVIRTLKRNKTKKMKIHALKDISFKIYGSNIC